mgnify:CR=1 FL=1
MADFDNNADLVKGIIPSEPKKNFTLSEKSDKSGGGVVSSYIKATGDHMLRHYEMFVASTIRLNTASQINPVDILHYHTFGDYRMVLDEGRLKFVYKHLDTTKLNGNTELSDERSIVARDEVSGISGVYTKDETGTYFSSQRISWLEQELNQGSSGLRLMLPSIGTMMMSTYGIKNINVAFKKLVLKLMDKVADLSETEFDGFDFCKYILNAIEQDDDYSAGLTSKPLADLQKEIADSDITSDKISKIVDELIESGTTRYIAEELVKLKQGASFTVDEQAAFGELPAMKGMEYEEEVFKIESANSGDKKNVKYMISHEGETYPFPVAQNKLVPYGEPKSAVEKQKKKFVRIPPPDTIVLYRIIIDQIFALHSYMMLIKKSDKINFGYVSPAVVPKRSQSAAKITPNMHAIGKDKPDSKSYIKKKVKDKAAFLNQIIQMRVVYSQMILQAQRSMSFDTKIFDDFYKGNLLEKEVRWISNALSEEAKFLVREPERSDVLSQLQYKMPGLEDPDSMFVLAEPDRRTVFYKIDIPLLKEVMIEYIEYFNEFTVTAAFSLESADSAPKEGKIAKALWGNIKRTAGSIFQQGEVIPFKFFNLLFSGVNKSLENNTLNFDPYPPSWSDTNILSMLTVDPSELGEILPPEEYQQYLNQYIDYITLRYQSRARVASAILTAIEGYRIKSATDYKKLKDEFAKTLADQDKNQKLMGTQYVFKAYNVVLAILRAELSVPLQLREEFIADGYEQEQREEISQKIQDRGYGSRGVLAVPQGHPKYTEIMKNPSLGRFLPWKRKPEPTPAPKPPKPPLPIDMIALVGKYAENPDPGFVHIWEDEVANQTHFSRRPSDGAQVYDFEYKKGSTAPYLTLDSNEISELNLRDYVGRPSGISLFVPPDHPITEDELRRLLMDNLVMVEQDRWRLPTLASCRKVIKMVKSMVSSPTTAGDIVNQEPDTFGTVPKTIELPPSSRFMNNPSLGRLGYERASKDTRGFITRKLKPRSPFVGFVERPVEGGPSYTYLKKEGKFYGSQIKDYQKSASEAAGYHGHLTDAEGRTTSVGVTMRPQKLGEASLRFISDTANFIATEGFEASASEEDTKKFVSILYLAASGEPLVNDNKKSPEFGEHLSLKHRDADNVREAVYLALHQQTTDHEFGHQADFADERMSDILGKSESEFDYSAETVAQFAEGSYEYIALARIDSINAVFSYGLKKNIEESAPTYRVAGQVSQLKLSKEYYGRTIDSNLHYPKEGESLTELIGRLRSNIIAKDELILVNPKRL